MIKYTRYWSLIILIGMAVFLLPSWSFGAAASGGQPGSFLSLGQGARALALGGSFTAICDDATAIYWNPAGLVQLNKFEFNTFYAPLWLDTNYNFLAYAHPTERWGVFGLGVVQLTSTDFKGRVNLEDQPSNFNITEHAYFLSYGNKISKRISSGVSIKFVEKEVASYSGSALGIDASLFYKSLNSKLTLGANFQNLMAPKIKLKETGDQYPLWPKFGIAYRIEPVSKKWEDKLILTADFKYSSYTKVKNNLGIEYWLKSLLALRAGKDGDNNPTLGFGVNYSNFLVDYALNFHPLGIGHKFSISYRFGYIGEAQYSKEAIKEKVAALYQNGLDYYSAQKFAAALSEWEKALIWEPENKQIQEKAKTVNQELEAIVNRKLVEQHLSQAYSYYEEGKLVDSLESWKEVVKLDPVNERAKEFIAKITEKLAKEDKDILQEREKEKEIVAINNFLKAGDELYTKGKYNEAIATWQKALAINPEHLTANRKIAETKEKIKNTIQLHFDKGVELYQKNQTSDAVKEFWTVLKLDPNHQQAKDYLDKIKAEEKQVRIVKKIDEKKISELYYKAADLYLKGKYQESVASLNELLNLDPTNESAEKLLGKAQSVLETIGGK